MSADRKPDVARHLTPPDAASLFGVSDWKVFDKRTWRPQASSFFNLQEDGTAHTATGVDWDGTTLTVDLAGVSAQTVSLMVQLSGGDADEASAVRIDNMSLNEPPRLPPIADAGPDQPFVECGMGGTTLDGTASSDPEGGLLSYSWQDDTYTEIGTNPTVDVEPPLGLHTYYLVVTSWLGLTGQDAVDVTVEDTIPPVAPVGPIAFDIEEDGSCAGVVPDLTGEIGPTDVCSPVTVTQDVPIGTPLALGVPVPVTLTTTDGSGNTADTAMTVTLIDSDSSCAVATGTGTGTGGGTATATGTATGTGTGTGATATATGTATGTGTGTGATATATGTATGTGTGSGTGGATAAGSGTGTATGSGTGTGTGSGTGSGTGGTPGTGTGGGTATGGTVDTAVPDKGGCSCNSPAGSGAPFAALFLVLWLVRRRSRASAILATVALVAIGLAPTDAHAEDTAILIGDLAGGSISASGEVDTFTFSAAPSQRVYIEQVSTNNYWNLEWRLKDTHGRVLLEDNDRFDDLESAILMGGIYTIEVEGTDGALGDYTFQLHDSPLADMGAIPLDVNTAGSIDAPGEIDRYTLNASPGLRVWPEVVATSSPWSLEWEIRDASDRVLRSDNSLESLDPVSLAGGPVTIDVRSDPAGGTATYTVRLNTVVDQDQATSLNTTLVGAASNYSSRDRFTFPAAGGERVYLNVPTGFTGTATLLDPNGAAISSAAGADVGPYDLLAGDWTVEVTPAAGTTLPDYTLDLASVDPDLQSTLVVGNAEAPAFTSIGQRAVYDLTVPANQRVFFEPLSGDATRYGWSLIHSSGRVVQPLTTNANFSGPYFLEGGDYTLTIDPEDDETGPFSFRLSDPTDTNLAALVGDVVNGSIAEPGAVHTTTFTAVAGQLLTIDVSAASPSAELGLELTDSAGRAIVPLTASLVDQIAVPLAGGAYELTVIPEGDVTGTFTYELVDAGLSGFVPSGVPTAFDTLINGVATSSTPSEHLISLGSDTLVYFELQSSSPATLFWELYDPAGGLIFGPAEGAWGPYDSLGPYWLAAGDYTLRFTSNGNDAYDLVVHDLTPTLTSTPLTLDTQVADALAVPGEAREYWFTLASDADLFFDNQAGSGSLDWTLVDAAGESVFAQSMSSQSSDPGRFRLAAGTYGLVLATDDETVPSYTFTVSTITDQQAVMALDAIQDFVLVTPGELWTGTLTLAAPTQVYFDSMIGATGATWTLTDPVGTPRFQEPSYDDQGALLLSAGTWTLEVQTTSDSIWPLQFRAVSATAVPETAVSLDQLVSVMPVTGFETYAWTLDVPTTQSVYVDLPGTTLTLLDPAGEVVSDRWRVVLEAGTYRVESTGTGIVWPIEWSISTTGDTTDVLVFGDHPVGQMDPVGQQTTYTFDVTTTPTRVMVDQIGTDYGIEWTLVDPVGQPVYDWTGAWDEDFNDVGLAAGTYVLKTRRFGTTFIPNYDFQLLQATSGPYLTYTRYNGSGPNLKRIAFEYDGVTVTKKYEDAIAELNGADGVVIAPDGDIVVGGGALVHKVNPITGAVVSVNSNGSAYHMSLDPSGTKIWSGGNPGPLLEIPLVPFGDGVQHTLTGDDTQVTQVVFDGAGNAFYTSGVGNSLGQFGILDLATFTTTRVHSSMGAAHGAVYDPFIDSFILSGEAQIAQIDVTTLAVTSSVATWPNWPLDQCAVDGEGLALAAANDGHLVFVDYAATGLVGDPASVMNTLFVDTFLDDIAPLSGLGSGCGDTSLSQLSPPQGTVVTPGDTILVSGRLPMADPTRPVTAILIDGAPPVSVDAAGNFYALHTVQTGENWIDIEWFDRCGDGMESLVLYGEDYTDGLPTLSDTVGSLVTSRFSDTSWNAELQQLMVDVVAENSSDTAIVGPVYLAIGSDLDALVTVANPDGATLEGRPYVEVVPAGQTLAPTELSEPATLTFHDPDIVQVRFTPLWLSTGNHAPSFTSAPPTEATTTQPWAYDADASDPDGHTLTFSLESGPSGMSLVLSTGQLDWAPGAADIGVHEVRIRVLDDFGGSALQSFVLTVTDGSANTPPIFATAPPVSASTGAAFAYDADALDPDGDALAFGLVDGPAGMAIDVATGVVSWDPTVAGQHSVEISVDDGRGGMATQAWTLDVGSLPTGGTGPILTSSPPTTAIANNLYLYQPAATDPDGDTLTWSLGAAPAGMSIDGTTGRVLWTPLETEVGAHPVSVEVSDGSATAAQQFEVTVSLQPANRAPVFASVAPSVAVVGVPFAYTAQAVDPEGGTISYSLDSGPAGSSIDASTGVVTWTPATAGPETLAIRAADQLGAEAVQVSYIQVRAGNSPPVVASGAPGAVLVGDAFEHRVTATDADGDTLQFALASGPDGLQVDPYTGVVTWLTSVADVGLHPVQISVADGLGGAVLDTWDLDVLVENGAPVATIDVGRDPACTNEPVWVCVSASDDLSDVLSVSLTVDGLATPLDAANCAVLDPPGPGPVILDATAVDGSGNAGLANYALNLQDCVLPTVTLTSPVDGDRLAVPTDVLGSASSMDPIDSWELTIRPGGTDQTQGVIVASGTGDVPATALSQFDPTLRENGVWTLRLEATDAVGRVGVAESSPVVDGQMKLGSYDVAFLDAQWTTSITSIALQRSYSTTRKDAVGDFGYGWELSATDVEIQTNGPLGEDGWTQLSCGAGFLFQPLCWDTVKPHIVVVKWPGGAVDAFDFTPVEASTFFPAVGQAAFTARPGTFSELRAVEDSFGFVGDGHLYRDLGLGGHYDPQQYVLTTPDGFEYLLDTEFGLLQTTDRNGNVTTYTYDGIYPELGGGVTWTRDAQGRIEAMLLPDGNSLEYTYDVAGDLVEVVDQGGAVVEFTYDAEHRLLEFSDQGFPPAAVLAYDADGRLISETDPTGLLVETQSDIVGWMETTLGPDLRLSTTREFNADGWVVAETLSSEGTIRRTEFTHDTNGQVTSRTLPSGAVETVERDAQGRVLLVNDADDVSEETTFGPTGAVASVATGGVIRRAFDADTVGNITAVRDSEGQLLRSYTWDQRGRLAAWSDEDGVGGSATRDPDGALTSVTDGSQTHLLELDDLGRLTMRTDASGGTESWARDASGRLLQYTDPMGRSWTRSYDLRGRLASVADPLGVAKSFSYDDAGRVTAIIRRTGTQVVYTYDTTGALTAIDGPDVHAEFEYDGFGQLTMASNEYVVVERAYDLDGRLASETISPQPGSAYPTTSTTFEYSEAGRLVAAVGTHGEWRWENDELGSPTVLYDSHAGGFGLDRVGWVWTSASGFDVDHDFSVAGRPVGIEVRDSAGAALYQRTLTRDAGGRIVEAADAHGTTRFEYDVSGRLTLEDHPAASSIPTVDYTYNAGGDRVAWTGHSSTEVGFDSAGRLVMDAENLYEVDAAGRRVASEVRATGDRTLYTWNSLNQLVGIEEPSGALTTFAYDALGRRVELSENGVPVFFAYDTALRAVLDASGALLTWVVTDPEGRILASYDGPSDETKLAVTDEFGTPLAWVLPDGAIEHVEATAFGASTTTATDVALHALTRHSRDPSGLIHADARYLDPTTGTFLSPDPVPNANLYSYALADPVNSWDPDGRNTSTYGPVVAIGALTVIESAPATVPPIQCALYISAGAAAGIALGFEIGGMPEMEVTECDVEVKPAEPEPQPEPEPERKPRPDQCLQNVAGCVGEDDDQEPQAIYWILYEKAALPPTPTGWTYVGLSSGVGDKAAIPGSWPQGCETVRQKRDANHHKNGAYDESYLVACLKSRYRINRAKGVQWSLDRAREGRYTDWAYLAIRGREQQVMDYHGGAWSHSASCPNDPPNCLHILEDPAAGIPALSGNEIRSVGKCNSRRFTYDTWASATRFWTGGQAAPFTGHDETQCPNVTDDESGADDDFQDSADEPYVTVELP